MEIPILLKRPVFRKRAVVTRPVPDVLPGPLVRSHLGPTTAELRAMIDDGRITFKCMTDDGKKLYELDRVKLGMEAAPVAALPLVRVLTPPPLTTVTEEEAPAPKVVKKKPTALEKTLKGLEVKKFVRKH
jgi:hypothetical protein